MLRRFSRWLPALVWMVLIFLGSNDVLSASHTSRFIEPLLRWLFTGISQDHIDEIHFLIRKTAHVCEYAVLMVLLYYALRPKTATMVPGESRMVKGRGALVVALTLTAAYAASDEFHQSFVASRGASFHDVVIDTCGALGALLPLWMWERYRAKRLVQGRS